MFLPAPPEGSRKGSPVAWAGARSMSQARDEPPLVQPKEASPPDGLASSDFPPLGAATPSKAEERRRQRTTSTPDRERESSVTFHDAYHAQLRERHGANVRAAEALEAFEGGGGSRERRSRKIVSPSDVDSLAEDVIRSLAARGELVTVERVRLLRNWRGTI